jgi:hypothetical protein
MLEYTGAGDGARLMMLVLHDDKRKMSNFPLRRRTNNPLLPVNIEKAVRVLK